MIQKLTEGLFLMSNDAIHAFACGCTAEQATGLPIETCRRHDQRTAMVKASAALQQMANCLDEAGDSSPFGGDNMATTGGAYLKEAGKYAVKAAKALIGADTE